MAKLSSDAEDEIVQRLEQQIRDKKKREIFHYRIKLAKKLMLLIVIAAVACGVHYRYQIGGLAAEMTERTPDPSLVGAPATTKAKVARRLAEIKKKHEEEKGSTGESGTGRPQAIAALGELDKVARRLAEIQKKHEEELEDIMK